MRRKLGIWGICALLIGCNLENADVGHPETFVKFFDFGEGLNVKQTADEGFICVGTYEFGASLSEAHLIKTDDAGNVEWLRIYGGDANNDGNIANDEPQMAARHVAELPAGGYIFVGDVINSNGSDQIASMVIALTDANGNIQDSVSIGDANQASDYHAQTFTFDANGSLVVLGTFEDANGFDRLILTKIDIAGTTLTQDWIKTFGIDQNNVDAGNSLHLNSSGEIIWSGSVFTADEATLESYMKVYAVVPASEASNGSTMGENDTDNFFARDIAPVGNNFAIIGTREIGGVKWMYLIKVDHFGNIISSSGLDFNDTNTGRGGNAEYEGVSICATFDSGLALLGTRTTPVGDTYGGGDRDFVLTKTDNSGNVVWSEIFGGAGDEFGGSVIEASDNGIVIFGTSTFQGTPRMMLIKTTSRGVVF